MIDDRQKIAFDLGGVIIRRSGPENFLIQGSAQSVKMTIQKFGPQNVFIISKAKQKWIQGNYDFLERQKFFESTGFKKQNMHFVNTYQDKAIKMKELKIDYIVDDKVIIARECLEKGFKPILFGNHKQFVEQNPQYTYVESWSDYRRLLQKIIK